MKYITCIQKALNLISRSPCPLAYGYVNHQEARGQSTEELEVRHALPGKTSCDIYTYIHTHTYLNILLERGSEKRSKGEKGKEWKGGYLGLTFLTYQKSKNKLYYERIASFPLLLCK